MEKVAYYYTFTSNKHVFAKCCQFLPQ